MTKRIDCDMPGCNAVAVFVCSCRRCSSEPEASERFHCCSQHKITVAFQHERVRERPAVWESVFR